MDLADRSPTGAPPRTVYSVSELSELLRQLLDANLPRLWVQGELSNFSRPASGHWYFTLKDSGAQLRCAMFRGANQRVLPKPKEGDEVLIRGQIGLYAARGDLQMIVEHLEPAGTGALLREFEELKRRLAAEGLFDAGLKRPIPAVPRRIGLITSATGAAVHDVLSTLQRRFPLAEVSLYPVPVQGTAAAPAIIKALQQLPRRVAVDVVLLVRGGGSLEDLWSFNEEAVARAVRACAVPVICGVGHEIDTTIADFAADLRAPTPTAAAELATPSVADWLSRVQQAQTALSQRHSVLRRVAGERLETLRARLDRAHPQRRLQQNEQRLDELEARLIAAFTRGRTRATERLGNASARLRAATPQRRLRLALRELESLQLTLHGAQQRNLAQAEQRRARAEALLLAVNPKAVLERGYAIVSNAQGQVVRSVQAVQAGDALRLSLVDGQLGVRVDSDTDPSRS